MATAAAAAGSSRTATRTPTAAAAVASAGSPAAEGASERGPFGEGSSSSAADGELKMIPDRTVFGGQSRSAESGLADDEAIERISRPVLSPRRFDYVGKGKVANLEPHLAPKSLDHGASRLGGAPDLEQ